MRRQGLLQLPPPLRGRQRRPPAAFLKKNAEIKARLRRSAGKGGSSAPRRLRLTLSPTLPHKGGGSRLSLRQRKLQKFTTRAGRNGFCSRKNSPARSPASLSR